MQGSSQSSFFVAVAGTRPPRPPKNTLFRGIVWRALISAIEMTQVTVPPEHWPQCCYCREAREVGEENTCKGHPVWHANKAPVICRNCFIRDLLINELRLTFRMLIIVCNRRFDVLNIILTILKYLSQFSPDFHLVFTIRLRISMRFHMTSHKC